MIFHKVFVVSPAEPRLPLLIEDAMRPDEPHSDDIQAPHANQETRLDNRVIDLYASFIRLFFLKRLLIYL